MDRFLNNTFSLLCFTALGVTIIFTPWLNVDSLIIPKLIILFSMSLFILPRVVFTWKNLFVNKIPKTLAVLSILIFISGQAKRCLRKYQLRMQLPMRKKRKIKKIKKWQN